MSKTAIIYWSGTGNTEAMANAIFDGAKEVNADTKLFSVDQITADEAKDYNNLILGCPAMADRFVLTLINNRIVGRQDFDFLENGAVFLSDSGRRAVLKRWQERKKESLTHPYLQEKLSWGLVPYLQALLLARCLRGDLDAYPPFLWK